MMLGFAVLVAWESIDSTAENFCSLALIQIELLAYLADCGSANANCCSGIGGRQSARWPVGNVIQIGASNRIHVGHKI